MGRKEDFSLGCEFVGFPLKIIRIDEPEKSYA